jgi:hypothetical protein
MNENKVLTTFGCNSKMEPNGTYQITPSADARAGVFYENRTCSEVGYCKQDGGKYQNCKNGVTQEMCTPYLFSSVGMPVNSLWGSTCRPYELLDGKCYVSKVDFVAGKACTSSTSYNGACLKSYLFKGLLENTWVDNCFEDKNYKDCEVESKPAAGGAEEYNKSFSAEKTCLQAGYTGACVDAANSCANNVVGTGCLTSEGKVWSQGKTCSELGY